jgi:hypothetical protein
LAKQSPGGWLANFPAPTIKMELDAMTIERYLYIVVRVLVFTKCPLTYGMAASIA